MLPRPSRKGTHVEAIERGLRAQGKTAEADAMKAKQGAAAKAAKGAS